MASPEPRPLPRPLPPTPPPTPPQSTTLHNNGFPRPGRAKLSFALGLDGANDIDQPSSTTPSTLSKDDPGLKRHPTIRKVFDSLRVDYEDELTVDEALLILCGEIPGRKYSPPTHPAFMRDFGEPGPVAEDKDEDEDEDEDETTPVQTPRVSRVNHFPPPPNSKHRSNKRSSKKGKEKAQASPKPAASLPPRQNSVPVPSLLVSVCHLTWFVNFYASFQASVVGSKQLHRNRDLRPLLLKAQALVHLASPIALRAHAILRELAEWRDFHERCVLRAEHRQVDYAGVNPFADAFRSFQEASARAEHSGNAKSGAPAGISEEAFVQRLVADKTAEILDGNTVGSIAKDLFALNNTVGEYAMAIDAALIARTERRKHVSKRGTMM